MVRKVKVFIGDILKQEYLETLNISAYRLVLKVSNYLISQILKGKVSLSPDMAYKFGIFLEWNSILVRYANFMRCK